MTKENAYLLEPIVSVLNKLQIKHLITYKSYNLFKSAADGKLATKFSIAELINICDSLCDINTDSFQRRKAPYNEASTNVLNSCTCQGSD